MISPLAIDLFCGLGGWAEGLLAEGWRVVGYDIEAHRYPKVVRGAESSKNSGGSWFNVAHNTTSGKGRNPDGRLGLEAVEGEWMEYPGELVIADVSTLHGSQFKDASLIVASPPCQEYSYMAMPWSLAKAKQRKYESGELDVADLTRLFDACFRIQREAEEAAGHHIPLIVENVRGAQKWVGRAKWNFGSYYLWGDVPALMPITLKVNFKIDSPHLHLNDPSRANVRRLSAVNPKLRPSKAVLIGASHETRGVKAEQLGTMEVSQPKREKDSFGWSQSSPLRQLSSRSNSRKAASAMIAKIPLALSQHIARTFLPEVSCAAD